MQNAMSDVGITAIEADILMGMDVDGKTITATSHSSSCCWVQEPIMAHPPDRTSDLSFSHFMALALKSSNILQKHLKLDFKEIEAVQPCLDTLNALPILEPNGKFIFLNADIIPGPGRSNEDITVPAAPFFAQCQHLISCKGEVCS